MFIPVLLGTARKGRQSEHVARFVHQQLLDAKIDTKLCDVKDYMTMATIPSWEDGADLPKDSDGETWRDTAKRADAFVFVSPEYNHSFPGEFKIVFDSAFKEYMHKPAGIVAVSRGGFGGTRLVETLQNVLVETGIIVSSHVLNVSKVEEVFGDDGTLKDEKYIERFGKVKDDLVWLTNAVQKA